MKYYVRRKTCKLKTNYIYHKMYTCFFLNSRPRKKNTLMLLEVDHGFSVFINPYLKAVRICSMDIFNSLNCRSAHII